MIRFTVIEIGEGETVSCSRCPVEPVDIGYRALGDIVAEARSICATWDDGTGPNILLTGAEPFAHPELPGLVSGIVDAGCARLAVDTDAVGLRSASNATGALMAGVRHVRFTLLAGTEGLHDAFAGAPGLFDATRDGVRSYRAAADTQGLEVSITAVVPVCGHNVHDLPAAVAAAVECGSDRVELRVTDAGMDLAAAVPWVTAACDTGVVNGVWVEVEGIPYCLLPGYDLHVADGVRTRCGSKGPVCAACPLDAVCGGAPRGASADQLSTLAVPAFAAQLASRIARAQTGSEC